METAPGHCKSHGARKVRLCSGLPAGRIIFSVFFQMRQVELPLRVSAVGNLACHHHQCTQTQPIPFKHNQSLFWEHRLQSEQTYPARDAEGWRLVCTETPWHSLCDQLQPTEVAINKLCGKPWHAGAGEGHNRSPALHEKCPFLSLHSAEQIIKPSPILSMSW